ncbi:MAG: dihydrofolate reductase [Candidatus Saccharimonadales bacterium]
MIRAIVAIDEKRGMADEQAIPWHLPSDQKYFVDKTATGIILMGYGTYLEFKKPFHGRTNYVATTRTDQLREGFIPVANSRQFLVEAKEDVWNIGGAGLLSSTLDLNDELYITQLVGDFHCTKFLPEYRDKFTLASSTPPAMENGITYSFQIWKRLLRQG